MRFTKGRKDKKEERKGEPVSREDASHSSRTITRSRPFVFSVDAPCVALGGELLPQAGSYLGFCTHTHTHTPSHLRRKHTRSQQTNSSPTHTYVHPITANKHNPSHTYVHTITTNKHALTHVRRKHTRSQQTNTDYLRVNDPSCLLHSDGYTYQRRRAVVCSRLVSAVRLFCV